MNEKDSHKQSVVIQCPDCGNLCNAIIEWWDNFPFASYVHKCEHCGYMITESEFNRVSKKL